MKIYTSYYAMMRKLNIDYKALFISLSNPFKSKMYDFDLLKPRNSDFIDYSNEDISDQEFKRRYIASKKPLMPEIIRKLEECYDKEGLPIILFCWEGPDKSCHRKWAAELINDYYGKEIVTEFTL